MLLVLCEERRSAPRDPIAFGRQRPVLLRGTLRDRHILAAHDHRVRRCATETYWQSRQWHGLPGIRIRTGATDVRLRSDQPKADQHQHAGQDGEQEAIGNAGRQVATD